MSDLFGSTLPETLPTVKGHGPRHTKLLDPLGDSSTRRKQVNHNQRTKAYFEKQGLTFAKAEVYNTWAGVRQDFLGCFDAIVFGKEFGIAGVQITSHENIGQRIRKLTDVPELAKWLEAGGLAVVIGWRQEGRFWNCKLEYVDEETIALRDSRRRKR